jgi:SAM-dependent methyltransferase
MTEESSGLQLAARPCPSCGSSDDSRVVVEASIDESLLGRFAFSSRKVPEYMHHRLIECPSCGLLYATPAPLSHVLTNLYRDADFASGEESRFASATYASLLTNLVGRLPPDAAALDIGTGDGAFLDRLLDAGVRDVVGIEPSAAPIAAAAPRVRRLIRKGVLTSDDFEPEQFHLVTSFQTLEHVPDPLSLCRTAHRLLRPGGSLLVVCHNRMAPLNRLLGRRSPIYDIEHLQLFSPASLSGLLERSGFSDVRTRPITNRYPLRYWLQLFPLPPSLKGRVLAAADWSRLGALSLSLPVGNLAAVGFKVHDRSAPLAS